MDNLYLRYKSIAVFDGAKQAAAPIIKLMASNTSVERVAYAADIFRALIGAGCANTGEWLSSLILTDDNPFALSVARGERAPERVKAQVSSELLTFKQLSLVKPDDFISPDTRDFFPMFGFGGFSLTADELIKSYSARGCGVFASGNAFVWRNGDICPAPSPVERLSDLKEYDEEKREILNNTKNFADGLPAFHALLYGDRGTGKSTTVRALAYEFRDRLKIIEIARGDIAALPLLINKIAGFKQKFIIFVDDLTFDEGDIAADEFKTAVEGSLCSSGNYIIYCTSNRRHLVRGSGAEHATDEKQAELALFDRFGLVITYINPDKQKFVGILKQILHSRGIKWRDEYAQVAELVALKKGGRSPRAAKQIADLIECSYAEHRGV